MRSTALALIALSLALAAAPPADAHVRLTTPAPRSNADDLTTGPCGGVAPALPVGSEGRPRLVAGSEVTVSLDVTIAHDPSDLVVALSGGPGDAGTFVVLYNATAEAGGGPRDVAVTIPADAAPSGSATLQVRYAGENTYYSCADVAIEGDAPADPSAEPSAEPSATPKVYPPAGPVELGDIRVASYNVQNFGNSKMNNKPGVPEILAQTIARYDVLEMQEISDINNVTAWALLDIVNTPPVYTARAVSDGVLAHLRLDRETREITYHMAFTTPIAGGVANATLRAGPSAQALRNASDVLAVLPVEGGASGSWFTGSAPALTKAQVSALAANAAHLELVPANAEDGADPVLVDVVPAGTVSELRFAAVGGAAEVVNATAGRTVGGPDVVDFIVVFAGANGHGAEGGGEVTVDYTIAVRPDSAIATASGLRTLDIGGPTLLGDAGASLGPKIQFNVQSSGGTLSSSFAVSVALEAAVRDRTAFVTITSAQNAVLARGRAEHTPHTGAPEARYALDLSPRVGTGGSAEQYGTFYRSRAIKVLSSKVYADPKNQFSREPKLTQVRHVPSGFEVTLLSIHTPPSEAVEEIDALADVYAAEAAGKDPAPSMLLMGDFNAGCDYVKQSDWASIRLWNETGTYYWALPEGTDTTVRESTDCPYDRFVIAGEPLREAYLPDSAIVYRYDRDFPSLQGDEPAALEVSDHYPIEITLRPSRANGNDPVPTVTPTPTPTPTATATATPVPVDGDLCKYDQATGETEACRCGNGVCEYFELIDRDSCPADCGSLYADARVAYRNVHNISRGIVAPSPVDGAYVVAGAVPSSAAAGSSAADPLSQMYPAGTVRDAKVPGAIVRAVVARSSKTVGPVKGAAEMYMFQDGTFLSGAAGGDGARELSAVRVVSVDANAADQSATVAVTHTMESLFVHPAPAGYRPIVHGPRTARVLPRDGSASNASAIATVSCERSAAGNPQIRFAATRPLLLRVPLPSGGLSETVNVQGPNPGSATEAFRNGTVQVTAEVCKAVTDGTAFLVGLSSDLDDLVAEDLSAPGFSRRTFAGSCGSGAAAPSNSAIFWLEEDRFDPALLHFDVFHTVADAVSVEVKLTGVQAPLVLSTDPDSAAPGHTRGSVAVPGVNVAAGQGAAEKLRGATLSVSNAAGVATPAGPGACAAYPSSDGFLVSPKPVDHAEVATAVARFASDGSALWLTPLGSTDAAATAVTRPSVGVAAGAILHADSTDLDEGSVILAGSFGVDLAVDADAWSSRLVVTSPRGPSTGSLNPNLQGAFVANLRSSTGEVRWISTGTGSPAHASDSTARAGASFSAGHVSGVGATSGAADGSTAPPTAGQASIYYAGTYVTRASFATSPVTPTRRAPPAPVPTPGPDPTGLAGPLPDQTPPRVPSPSGVYHTTLSLGWVRPFPEGSATQDEMDGTKGLAVAEVVDGAQAGTKVLRYTVFHNVAGATKVRIFKAGGNGLDITVEGAAAAKYPVHGTTDTPLSQEAIAALEAAEVRVQVATAQRANGALEGVLGVSRDAETSGFAALCAPGSAPGISGAEPDAPPCAASLHLLPREAAAAAESARSAELVTFSALSRGDVYVDGQEAEAGLGVVGPPELERDGSNVGSRISGSAVTRTLLSIPASAALDELAGLAVNATTGEPAMHPWRDFTATVSNGTANVASDGFRLTYNGTGVRPAPEPTPSVTYHGAMSGENVEPPVETESVGALHASYDPNSRDLTIAVVHTHSIADVAQVAVFSGVRGVLDGVSVFSTTELLTFGNATAGGALMETFKNVPASVASDLERGYLYVQIRSIASGAGILRGQLLRRETVSAVGGGLSFAALALPTEDAPASSASARSPHIAVALLAIKGDDALGYTLRYSLVHNVPGADAAHIHGPAAVGADAGVLVDLDLTAGDRGAATGVVENVAAATVGHLRAGLTYVNVHSAAAQDGAARGQVYQTSNMTAPEGPAVETWYAELTQGGEDPAVAATAKGRGLAHCVLDREARTLTVHLTHSVAKPTQIHVHGPVTENSGNAPVVETIADSAESSASPVTATIPMPKAHRRWLSSVLLYINVHSEDDPAGAIRGFLDNAAPKSLISTYTSAALKEGAADEVAVAVVHVSGPVLEWRVMSGVAGTDPRRFAIGRVGGAVADAFPLYAPAPGTSDPAVASAGPGDYVSSHATATPSVIALLDAGAAELLVLDSAGALLAKGSLDRIAQYYEMRPGGPRWDVFPFTYVSREPQDLNKPFGTPYNYIARLDFATGILQWARPLGDHNTRDFAILATASAHGDLQQQQQQQGGQSGMILAGSAAATAELTGSTNAGNATIDFNGAAIPLAPSVGPSGSSPAWNNIASTPRAVVVRLDEDLRALWASQGAPLRREASAAATSVSVDAARGVVSATMWSSAGVLAVKAASSTGAAAAPVAFGQASPSIAWAARVSLDATTGHAVAATPMHPWTHLAAPEGYGAIDAVAPVAASWAASAGGPLAMPYASGTGYAVVSEEGDSDSLNGHASGSGNAFNGGRGLYAVVAKGAGRPESTAFAVVEPRADPDATPTPSGEPSACPNAAADQEECESRSRVWDLDVCACLCPNPLNTGADCDKTRVAGTVTNGAGNAATVEAAVARFAEVMGIPRENLEDSLARLRRAASGAASRIASLATSLGSLFVRSRARSAAPAPLQVTTDATFVADVGAASNQTAEGAAEALLLAWEDQSDFRLQAMSVSSVAAGDVSMCVGVSCTTRGEVCISGTCTTIEAARARHEKALAGGTGTGTDPEESGGMKTWMYAAIGGGVALVIAVVAIVVVKSRGSSGGGGDDFSHGSFSDVRGGGGVDKRSSTATRQRPKEINDADDPFALPPPPPS